MNGAPNRESMVGLVPRDGETVVLIRGFPSANDVWTVRAARAVHTALGRVLEQAEAREPVAELPREVSPGEAAPDELVRRMVAVIAANCQCQDCKAERAVAAGGAREAPRMEPEVAAGRGEVGGAGLTVTPPAKASSGEDDDVRREAMAYAVELFRPEPGRQAAAAEAVVAYARTLEAYLRRGSPPC